MFSEMQRAMLIHHEIRPWIKLEERSEVLLYVDLVAVDVSRLHLSTGCHIDCDNEVHKICQDFMLALILLRSAPKSRQCDRKVDGAEHLPLVRLHFAPLSFTRIPRARC